MSFSVGYEYVFVASVEPRPELRSHSNENCWVIIFRAVYSDFRQSSYVKDLNNKIVQCWNNILLCILDNSASSTYDRCLMSSNTMVKEITSDVTWILGLIIVRKRLQIVFIWGRHEKEYTYRRPYVLEIHYLLEWLQSLEFCLFY